MSVFQVRRVQSNENPHNGLISENKPVSPGQRPCGRSVHSEALLIENSAIPGKRIKAVDAIVGPSCSVHHLVKVAADVSHGAAAASQGVQHDRRVFAWT